MTNDRFTAFYLSYDELLQMPHNASQSIPSVEELDEIRRISKLVDEVTGEPVRFCTTT